MDTARLSKLAEDWKAAKLKEDMAREERLLTENLIALELPGPDEGAISDKNDRFKITATRKLLRSLDLDTYDQEKTNIPPDLDPVILTPKLDLKRLRAIESANPNLHAICQKFITVKPAKVAVKVVEVEKDA